MAKLQTLKPRLQAAPARIAAMQPGSWRTDKQSSTQRGYGYKWQQARAGYLASHPLCVYCAKAGLVRAASVVDHIVAHQGDMKLFWDHSNWQALCAPCHSSTKQREEARAGGGAKSGVDFF